MAADGVSFAISLGLNFAFLFLIYFLFALLRDAAPTKKFYAPRRYMRDPRGRGTSPSPSPQPSPARGGGGNVPPPSSSSSASSSKRPKRLPTGWFSWIGVVHRATQEDVIGVAGMDAAVYLAFLKLCEFFIIIIFFNFDVKFLFLVFFRLGKNSPPPPPPPSNQQNSQRALHLRDVLVPCHGPPNKPRRNRSKQTQSFGSPRTERVHLLDPRGDTTGETKQEVDLVWCG